MVSKGLTPTGAPAPAPPPAPRLVLSKTAVNFGTVAPGTPVQEAVVLTNEGSGPAQLVLGAPSAPFALSHDCPAQLAATASCTLTASFTPTQAGAAEGLLTVAASGSAPVQVTLSGAGAADLTISGFGAYPAFLNVPVGRTIQRDFYISNASAQSVTITKPVVSGAGYSALTTCMDAVSLKTLAPGAVCLVRVQVAPSSVGSHAGAVSVSASSGGASASYALHTSGVAPTYSSTLVANGAVQVANSTNWKLTMRPEARIDAATGLLVVDAFLSSSGSGALPIGNYGLTLTGPAGASNATHKIVSHLSNVRVTNAVPAAPGTYVVGDPGGMLKMTFSVSSTLRITSYSLTLNNAPTSSMTLTQDMD